MTDPHQKMTSIIQQLWTVAQKLAEFADQQTEQLDFETYSAVSEYETKLLAYAELLSIRDPAQFLQEEFESAREFLEELRSRLSERPR